jgi:hypothetical protein
MAVSPLGAARLRRRLTVEEAAARARMAVDQVKSLEENCMYRFGSNADALAAALVYATALGISEREARQIAGLPVASRFVDPWSLRRSMAICAFLAAVGALVWFGFRPELGSDSTAAATPAAASQATGDPAAALPEPWEIQVDVYNGTGAGNAAASMANRVAGTRSATTTGRRSSTTRRVDRPSPRRSRMSWASAPQHCPGATVPTAW